LEKQDERLAEMVMELRALSGHLIQALTNKVPQGYLPLDVHKDAIRQLNELHRENVRALNRAWGWVFHAALAIDKLAPAVDQVIAGATVGAAKSPDALAAQP
jgi:hypothetical protein